MATTVQPDWSFRFFDNREKYLLFVSTCNEKQIIAERIAMDIHYLQPQPPALRVFDAGMGAAAAPGRITFGRSHTRCAADTGCGKPPAAHRTCEVTAV